jgi:hypothetical protein
MALLAELYFIGDVRKKVNSFFYFVTYLLSYGRAPFPQYTAPCSG